MVTLHEVFFFQVEDGIRVGHVTGVQTCALPICFGVLIAGGAIAFFLGALMLFQDLPESMSISFAWLIPSTIVMVLFFIWIAFEGIRVQFKTSYTGNQAMIGKVAKVVDEVSPHKGRVFVRGEYWNAISDEKLKKGEECIILEVEDLTLKVAKFLSEDKA